MNILLLGSGGREHTLAWKLTKSPLIDKLFISPGNAGTDELGENIELDTNNHKLLSNFLLDNHIEMLIVGPEQALVDGIHNRIAEDEKLKHITVIGPKKEGAQLEGSKDFAKKFMEKYNIPTAKYKTFDSKNLNDGLNYLKTMTPPYVLKADGLAAGKGVLILDDLKEAQQTLVDMIDKNKFGSASSKVIVEEFLSGIELSVFVLTDGNAYVLLPEAKDYKRIGEGDTGLNTGGMGSISPVPFAGKEFMSLVKRNIIEPTINGLKEENIDFSGFIFFGLIKVNEKPYVIEYNVRLGDPETETIIPRLKTDLLKLFLSLGSKTLSNQKVLFDERAAASVMLVSGGYPGNYDKGKEITGIQKIENQMLFHAGTKKADGKLYTNGGRVLAITSLGNSIEEALLSSYSTAKNIKFDYKYYRKDLGFDL
jgi:phosphoribosylamine--glycine ligase